MQSVNQNLLTGIDVGGTKVHIADTLSTTIRRYSTPDYPSMDAVLEDYFNTMGVMPARIAIGMAGPRDDETGEISGTNIPWPAFNPQEASQHYGIEFSTVNDMVATAAGVLQETGIDLLALKPGAIPKKGAKVVIALSTGIGASAAMWDEHSNRYVILAGEGGHIGFQPKNEEELQYLNYLHQKYPEASAEIALSGKHGIENLVDHSLKNLQTENLAHSIETAKTSGNPVGSVLLEYATEGHGPDRQTAQTILGQLGAMLGSVIRDLTVAYKASGGVYLTGSVALGLSEYFVQNTELVARFIHKGAVHDDWLESTPIYLVTDPNVAVVGALALAKDF